MNLHEYQAKELLASYGVPIQRGVLVENINEIETAFAKLKELTNTGWCVVKAQVHAGGRGKGGGVKLAKNMDELKLHAGNILGMMLKTPQTPGGMDGAGKLVRKILITEDVYYPDADGNMDVNEFYYSILMDRERKCNVIVYSTEGGMDIEKVAEETPHLLHKEYIHPHLGLQAYQTRNIANNLGLEGAAFKAILLIIKLI